MKTCRYVLFLLFFCASLISTAQINEVQVKAYLNKDTVLLGEHFTYSISITYPADYEIALPDSVDIHEPLEWIGKSYFNTVCKKNVCTDSIQYHLRTFSTLNNITLQLPVFLFKTSRHDTLIVLPSSQNIHVKKIHKGTPSFSWEENTAYMELKPLVNYWYYGISIVLVFIALIILYLLIGPFFLRRIKLFNLGINHQRFIKDFDDQILSFTTFRKASDLEKSITLWKYYLTRLEGKPYTTLTTTELKSSQDMEEVIVPLQNIDRFLYGGLSQGEIMESIQSLRRFSNKRFVKKKKEIRNAG